MAQKIYVAIEQEILVADDATIADIDAVIKANFGVTSKSKYRWGTGSVLYPGNSEDE